MLHKDEFLNAHPDVHTGMNAYSVDGEKLGEVEMLDEDSMTIEKGWFFPGISPFGTMMWWMFARTR